MRPAVKAARIRHAARILLAGRLSPGWERDCRRPTLGLRSGPAGGARRATGAERRLDYLQLPAIRDALLRSGRLAGQPVDAHRAALPRGHARGAGAGDRTHRFQVRQALTGNPRVMPASRAVNIPVPGLAAGPGPGAGDTKTCVALAGAACWCEVGGERLGW